MGADDLGGVPIGHLAEDRAVAGDGGLGLIVLRAELLGLIQRLAHVTGVAAIPVFLNGDPPNLQQMQPPVARLGELNIQRRAALAQTFQLAREVEQLRHARRINMTAGKIAMHHHRLVYACAAGDRVGLAAFVIVIEHVIRRAGIKLMRHDHAAQRHLA